MNGYEEEDGENDQNDSTLNAHQRGKVIKQKNKGKN